MVTARVQVQSLGRNLYHVIIVTAEVKSDLIRVSLQFNKPALNVMVMEKLLVKHVQNVKVTEKFKAMKIFLLKYQKVLMMVTV